MATAAADDNAIYATSLVRGAPVRLKVAGCKANIQLSVLNCVFDEQGMYMYMSSCSNN